MNYAILSDVHGRHRKLHAVLVDAHAHGVDQIISLGDVGGDDCLTLLREAGAVAVFGNYEVSGWRHLPPEHRAWVRTWPPLLVGDSFLAVHAAPWWPDGLRTVRDFGAWLKRTGRSWRMLFPYLTEDNDDIWRALAELETHDKAVLFHGHTHRQAIWRWKPSGRRQRIRRRNVRIEPDHRYIVGVGSVGLPEDGGWASYALYDSDACCVRLVHLARRPAQ
jgi:hypothetical protein